ncbi:hypothetical protein FQA39_LY12792 [Lamprigera yunnana]|nr:hypothetical protein FQA39_LY12792 [Lamprigera yunnana]
MPNLSKLKKQIESTNNINDITNAMHLVASAKLNKMDPSVESTMIGFTFEPSPKEILDTAVNIYLNAVIYGTIIESQVSEQASRRMAMENATTNGEEMINKLKIQFNRERQAAITQELSEIISGANAQEN